MVMQKNIEEKICIILFVLFNNPVTTISAKESTLAIDTQVERETLPQRRQENIV